MGFVNIFHHLDLDIITLNLPISGTQNLLSQCPGTRDICHSQGTWAGCCRQVGTEEPSLSFTLFFSHHTTEMMESLDYIIYIFYYVFLKRKGGTSLWHLQNREVEKKKHCSAFGAVALA